MDFFLKDIENKEYVTWSLLINDLNASLSYNPFCKSNSYYDIFKNIILSLILGKEIILLDSDFTDNELLNLTGNTEYQEYTVTINKKEFPIIHNKIQLIESLRKTSSNWKVTLFTSGTTGIPKKITHNFNSATRFVKINEGQAKSIWGFAYNPTHMAGLQVFFQAILNGNSLVRLFGLNTSIIHNEIKQNLITNISATPTFYRLLLPSKETFQSIERITSGGEKFDKRMMHQLKDIFPNSKINNVYASTEAGTLFASENDIFSIKPEYENFILVENGELLIHNSLLGNSEFNVKEWYNTGDLIQIIANNPLKFRFISRNSDMINVGGYKVNPLEVEETLLTIPGIQNVRVYPKRNSILGNIICCDVVCTNGEITESTLRSFLQTKLQEFKIPRIIRFVDNLSTTRTGKIKRN